VLPEDVTDLTLDVLRHRIVLSYQAFAESLSADAIIRRITNHVTVPEAPLEHHVAVGQES
jgi:MoxR-like ATPase